MIFTRQTSLKVYLALGLLGIFCDLKSQLLLDSYGDGNFSANPVWSGSTSDWVVVANSSAGPDQTGSNTLRLAATPGSAGSRYLSAPVGYWGNNQEWGFWIGRRSQAFTAQNQMHIWLYANEADLTSSSVDGYRLAIGDDSGDDEIRLQYIVNGAVSATVISSANVIPNGLTDISFLIRVTRTSSGNWTLFTSALPAMNGDGISSLTIPNSSNANVNQGNATNNSLAPASDGFLGLVGIHTTSAEACTAIEWDQVYFTTDYQYEISTIGGNLTVTDLAANGETLEVSENGSSIRFNASGRRYSLNGGIASAMPADIPLSGLNSITINTAAGSDVINLGAFSNTLPSLTINAGSDNDIVNFNGDISFSAGSNLDVNLQDDHMTPGIDQVSVAGNANLVLSGSGAVLIKVSRSVVFNSGSSLQTMDGDLTVEANQQAIATIAPFIGINVLGALLECQGNGALTLLGKGGDGGGPQKYGIHITGQVKGGADQKLHIVGTGGAGMGGGGMNAGVLVEGSTATISSINCDVEILGYGGGGTAGGGINTGVHLINGAVISAGSTGQVMVEGHGGLTTGPANRGVLIAGTGSKISSSGGNVEVKGLGGGSGSSANNHGVDLESGAEISAGGMGDVVVEGVGGSSSGTSSYGVLLSGTNSRISSSGGNIDVSGTGGNGSSGSNFGVYLLDNTIIIPSGSGNVEVTGLGGSGSGDFNQGIRVSNASIESTNGDVSVYGTGGGSGASSFNYGISLYSGGKIKPGGMGDVLAEGLGGPTVGVGNTGVDLAFPGSEISSSGGNVMVKGTGGGTGSSSGNNGVRLLSGGLITSGGMGTVTVHGSGSLVSTTQENTGILLNLDDTKISSGGGDVFLIADEGAATQTYGLVTENGTPRISTLDNGGNIQIKSNSIVLNSVDVIETNPSHQVEISVLSPGTAIDLGDPFNPFNGPMALSDTELDQISTGTLVIGDGTAGDITISQNISLPQPTDLRLYTSGDIIFNESINTNGADLLLVTNPKTIYPRFSGSDVQVAEINFLSDLGIEINGTSPGNGSGMSYTQLNLVGVIDLTNLGLEFSGTYIPGAGEQFIIVINDGMEPIQGIFTGLPEGSVLPDFRGSGLDAVISYTGGDGNDVTISLCAEVLNVTTNTIYCDGAAALAAASPGDIIEFPAGSYQESLVITQPVVFRTNGGSVTIQEVTLNGSGYLLTLDSDFEITELTLTNGLIRTNGHNLKCGTISGGGPGSYVVTD